MTISASVGTSRLRNSALAGQEAARQARARQGPGPPRVVLLFATIGYDAAALLERVRAEFPDVPLLGCSAEGTIAEGWSDESPFSVLVLALGGDLEVETGCVTGLQADSFRAGTRIAEQVGARRGSSSRLLLLFPDGITLNATRFLKALASLAPLPVFGGAAGDNWKLSRSWQCLDDRVLTDGAVWALLSGDFAVCSAFNHGCVPIGEELTVTRSEGNRIQAINGRPVIEFLQDYMLVHPAGGQSSTLNIAIGFAAPGFFQEHDRDYEFLITHLVLTEEQRQGGFITVLPELPAGTRIWLVRRDPEVMHRRVDDLAVALQRSLAGRTPGVVLHFDCSGRGRAVFREEQIHAHLRRLQEQTGVGLPWGGFYTYGELASVGGVPCFHNYTAALVALV